jgi:protein TonB
MRANNKEPAWNFGDAAVMGLIVGLHAYALWHIVHIKPPEPLPPPAILQVSLVIPPEEPPPPEPPKIEPPKVQPKVVQKTPPPIPVEQPKIITDTPVQNPIPPPPPVDPTPPAPPPPRPSTSSYLVVKEQAQPIYPRKALRDGIEGKVTLLISVDEKGVPTEAKVVKSSGNFDLDNAARTAVMKFLFVPQTYNGAPIKSQGLQDIIFTLNEG